MRRGRKAVQEDEFRVAGLAVFAKEDVESLIHDGSRLQRGLGDSGGIGHLTLLFVRHRCDEPCIGVLPVVQAVLVIPLGAPADCSPDNTSRFVHNVPASLPYASIAIPACSSSARAGT